MLRIDQPRRDVAEKAVGDAKPSEYLPEWETVMGTVSQPSRLKSFVVVTLIIAGMAAIILGILVLLISVLVFEDRARARDLGQWEASDPKVREWYQSLMQPDVPTASCCGESDAYWADEIHIRDGRTYATITDDRPDGPLGRPHVAAGTEIEIPNNKLKWDRSNPTGHGVVFLTRSRYVLCFVQPGGV